MNILQANIGKDTAGGSHKRTIHGKRVKRV